MNSLLSQRFLAILIVNFVWVMLVTKLLGTNILVSFVGTVIITVFVRWLWDKTQTR